MGKIIDLKNQDTQYVLCTEGNLACAQGYLYAYPCDIMCVCVCVCVCVDVCRALVRGIFFFFAYMKYVDICCELF